MKIDFVFPKNIKNDPKKAGQIAFRKILWDGSRYAVAPVHTRFDTIEWFVWDAETVEFLADKAKVIRQEPTLEKAIEGLADNYEIRWA